MREIKFRAKDLDGNWRYGSLWHELGEWFIYENRDHKVYGETIGQCTGLKDKNGKEIYEGDIIKLWVGEKSQTVGTITYGGWQYIVTMEVAGKEKTNYFGYNSEDIEPDKIEIIGNIYENPELLK